MILAPFIYDNVRLLLLSKTDEIPRTVSPIRAATSASTSWRHIGARAFAAFDDRHVNVYMGPSAQKHTIDDFNADNFDHRDLGLHPRRADLGRPAGPRRRSDRHRHEHEPAARRAALGRRPIATSSPSTTRATPRSPGRPRTCPTPTRRSISIRTSATQWGLPAPRMTYDWRRPNERARVEFMQEKMVEIGRAMGAAHVWLAPLGPGAPGAHHQGGTRMGSDPKNSVVNKYSQSWDIPNLFVIGSSTIPTDERVQSDADDPGARLHDRRRDREPLPEESGTAGLAETLRSLRSREAASGIRHISAELRIWLRIRRRRARNDKQKLRGSRTGEPWQPRKPMSSSSASAQRAAFLRPSLARPA